MSVSIRINLNRFGFGWCLACAFLVASEGRGWLTLAFGALAFLNAFQVRPRA